MGTLGSGPTAEPDAELHGRLAATAAAAKVASTDLFYDPEAQGASLRVDRRRRAGSGAGGVGAGGRGRSLGLDEAFLRALLDPEASLIARDRLAGVLAHRRELVHDLIEPVLELLQARG